LIDLTIQKLRGKSLVTKVTGPDLRVPKYRELFCDYYKLTRPQTAIMCILFLRGAQTIGEIKSRSYRIYEFKGLSETEDTLDNLINIENGPFVVKLPKDSGRESRYTHLFCGEPKQAEHIKAPTLEDRVVTLEEEIKFLKEMNNELKAEFDNFKQSFE
jgi:hypothetical protein